MLPLLCRCPDTWVLSVTLPDTLPLMSWPQQRRVHPLHLVSSDKLFNWPYGRDSKTLFQNVVPHHCLGCIWSRRDKKENKQLAQSIRATISQFNAVTNCVLSTILESKELKTQPRAKILEKWIRIGRQCRILNNFSSLKAIVSALQSTSVYRLKKTWACVPKDTMLMFEELCEIFSDCDNFATSRELLLKVGMSLSCQVVISPKAELSPVPDQ
ncbi:ral guanine nucleotide dissociation stimulator-like 1 isoform X1 [Patagioenas fasciata]|uniref:ral guanine nucleotide dissociation stimulator-like 1 isoform X1 n=1 Tax=Patagioenas fasciata TaxID=372321 RepID=UPI003A98EFFF